MNTQNYLENNYKYDFYQNTYQNTIKPIISLHHPEINDELKKIADSKMSRLHTSDPIHDRIFHAAISRGQKDVVSFLMNQGVSTKALVNGITPLYRACENNQLEIASLLIENDPTLAHQKNDLSDYSLTHQRLEFDKATPIEGAIKAGNLDLVKLLLNHGVPLDEKNDELRTNLYLAVKSSREEIALFFIEKGSKLEIMDRSCISLISLAVKNGCLKVVQELVKRDISTNKIRNDFEDPLLMSAASKDSELLKFLLTTDAKEHLNFNNSFYTPLKSAAINGNLENVKILLDAGADPKATFYNNQTLIESVKEKLIELKKPLQSPSYGSIRTAEDRKLMEEDNQNSIQKLQEVIDFIETHYLNLK